MAHVLSVHFQNVVIILRVSNEAAAHGCEARVDTPFWTMRDGAIRR